MYIEKKANGWAVHFWTMGSEMQVRAFQTRKEANRFFKEITNHGLLACIVRHYV